MEENEIIDEPFVQYLVTVGPDGRVISVVFNNDIDLPNEGLDSEGNTVIHYYDDIDDLADFVGNQYYDFDSEEFIASPSKPHQYVTWDSSSNTWVPNEDSYLSAIRGVTVSLLKETDWCVLPDVPLSTEEISEAKTFRQEVRDYPELVQGKGDYEVPPSERTDWPAVPDFLKAASNNLRVLTQFL